MLTKQDYQTALDIQDACNLSGVVFAFAEIMERLCDEASELKKDTNWKNTHPIVVLFADKLLALSTAIKPESYYHDAYRICKERAQCLEVE